MGTVQNRLPNSLSEEMKPKKCAISSSTFFREEAQLRTMSRFNASHSYENYPEVALIEAFKDGMAPSLKQMIMVTRRHPPHPHRRNGRT